MDLGKCPAAHMEGLELDGGWVVGARIDRGPQGTGGNFSFGYWISHPDRGKAFLKALDYSRALRAGDVAAALQTLVNAYIYERDLLLDCSNSRLSRVVLPLAHGQTDVDGFDLPVNYLILEPADGDVRNQFAAMEAMKAFDEAWVLRVLHNTATGIQQLHGRNIVHQDVKPSNLLTFGRDGDTKLGDLGRGERRGQAAPTSPLESQAIRPMRLLSNSMGIFRLTGALAVGAVISTTSAA